MPQTPEEKLAFIEGKLDKILIYLFGDTSLDRDAMGLGKQIRVELKSAHKEIMQEINDIRNDIENAAKERREIWESIENVEKKQIKHGVMTAVMWSAVGGTIALIFAYWIQSLRVPVPHVGLMGHYKNIFLIIKTML